MYISILNAFFKLNYISDLLLTFLFFIFYNTILTFSVIEWDENDVALFLKNMRLEKYSEHFKKENIKGRIYCFLKDEEAQ